MRAMSWLKWIFVLLFAGFVFAVAMALDPEAVPAPRPAPGPWVLPQADVVYVLETRQHGDQLAYVAVSGRSMGQANPDIIVRRNAIVTLTLINGLDTVSDLTIPALGVDSGLLVGRGARTTMTFQAKQVGDFLYMSSFPKLRSEGLVGRLVVEPAEADPRPVARRPELLTD